MKTRKEYTGFIDIKGFEVEVYITFDLLEEHDTNYLAVVEGSVEVEVLYDSVWSEEELEDAFWQDEARILEYSECVGV